MSMLDVKGNYKPTPDRKNRVRVVAKTIGPSRVKPYPKDLTDINLIVSRFTKEHLRRMVQMNPGWYEDVSNVGDFRESHERVLRGQEMFMRFPAEIRKKFENDASRFYEFASKPENKKTLKEMMSLKTGKDIEREQRKGDGSQSNNTPSVETPKTGDENKNTPEKKEKN